MRKALSLALIVTVLAVVAYFMKPSDEKCLKVAQQKFEEKLQNTAPGLPPNVNQEIWQETLEKSFKESLRIDDKFVYKIISQQKGSESSKIGWAAFGFVQIDFK